ncbi:unnamed protein product [Rotaria socialis]|uniref:Uncharacterized protein n=1 Tax=Rotaria socialis TaxID=392032 RepID=A0A821NFM9_9BILA|nr:unnamed protein product [Rotaria socialis]CAF3354615.1 unnamed protein product [Rotaria socialis]CAF3656582.1 unnamed protein product [Rotaria socialis]CAF3671239.1 unnamed protein product [Rotaria socialis]CAF3745283.1 unnamed protein product [Rotaria socialis]
MDLRRIATIIGTANSYSILKWLSILTSLLITILAFLLLVSFNSDSLFKYDAVHLDDIIPTSNLSVQHSQIIAEGSIGIWYSCVKLEPSSVTVCDPWTQTTRPHHFQTIMILYTFALYFANLIIFPSWVLFILLVYNTNNCYLRYIVGLIWASCLFTLILLCILVSILDLIRLTKFYTPGRFFEGTEFLSFRSGRAMDYLMSATIISAICFVLSIITFAGKLFIDREVAESERELLKQISDENSPTAWQKPTMIPRTRTSSDDHSEEPPPYEYSN